MEVKIESAKLKDEIIIIETLEGTCEIRTEHNVFHSIIFELNNKQKPIPSIWDFARTNILDISEKYHIKKQIESDFYGYLITKDGEEINLRISDGLILFLGTDIPLYIESDLLTALPDNQPLPLEVQLEKAKKDENYTLAKELKKKIEDSKKNGTN